jgi:hypothetical protein
MPILTIRPLQSVLRRSHGPMRFCLTLNSELVTTVSARLASAEQGLAPLRRTCLVEVSGISLMHSSGVQEALHSAVGEGAEDQVGRRGVKIWRSFVT